MLLKTKIDNKILKILSKKKTILKKENKLN